MSTESPAFHHLIAKGKKASLSAALGVALTCAPLALDAQDLGEVCLSLANSGLQDKRKSSVLVDTFVGEFRHVCERQEHRLERLNSASGGFQLAFKGFGLGGRGDSGSTSSENYVSERCALGESNFASHVRATDEISIGRYLADRVVQCAEILSKSKREALLGLIQVDESDAGFNVDVRYVAGETALTYSLARVTNALGCFADKSKGIEAIGNVVLRPNASNAFYCDKPEGVGVLGSFVFEASVDGSIQTRTVPFDVLSRDRELEILETANQLIDDKLAPLRSGNVIRRGSFVCSPDRVVGLTQWEEACSQYISVEADDDYDVLLSLNMFDHPKDSFAPIYRLDVSNKTKAGFTASVSLAYQHINQLQVNWLAISK